MPAHARRDGQIPGGGEAHRLLHIGNRGRAQDDPGAE
jgi:hypothetical protein